MRRRRKEEEANIVAAKWRPQPAQPTGKKGPTESTRNLLNMTPRDGEPINATVGKSGGGRVLHHAPASASIKALAAPANNSWGGGAKQSLRIARQGCFFVRNLLT